MAKVENSVSLARKEFPPTLHTLNFILHHLEFYFYMIFKLITVRFSCIEGEVEERGGFKDRFYDFSIILIHSEKLLTHTGSKEVFSLKFLIFSQYKNQRKP